MTKVAGQLSAWGGGGRLEEGRVYPPTGRQRAGKVGELRS